MLGHSPPATPKHGVTLCSPKAIAMARSSSTARHAAPAAIRSIAGLLDLKIGELARS